MLKWGSDPKLLNIRVFIIKEEEENHLTALQIQYNAMCIYMNETFGPLGAWRE